MTCVKHFCIKGNFLKRSYCFIVVLLSTSTLEALPDQGKVTSGHADFQSPNSQTLLITTSDKTIINYPEFNIGKNEHVQFIQPSANSTVLNRVTGQNPSQIFGQLTANGRVFLVNPYGIYFGPHATVNTGSFLASTLNIRDDDFLNDTFDFFLEKGFKPGKIINEGSISSPEGFIVFLSPLIENQGVVTAKAGKIVLASAERVTLDFTGDQLIKFALDGELECAVIENYGTIEAANGQVEISMQAAREAIRTVINTDGIIPASQIEESNGVIRLIGNSYIAGNQVRIEGDANSSVTIQGTIDAANPNCNEKGGNIHIFGDQIYLTETYIDASGDAGGGQILIGGEFQGSGDSPHANLTFMDNQSEIYADAYNTGNGGEVILWSDDITVFDGDIYTRGGSQNGNGGLVETSGKMQLGVSEGFVDTSAKNGRCGDWLLDPNSVTIANGGTATLAQVTSNCTNSSSFTISPSSINTSTSNVAICANNSSSSIITVFNAITMTRNGINLSLNSSGTISLASNITTKGGILTLSGKTNLTGPIILDTTGSGSVGGANLIFTGAGTIDGQQTLNCQVGSGTITVGGAIGATTPISSLQASASSISLSTVSSVGSVSLGANSATIGNITTQGGAINLLTPVTISGNTTFDTTNATPAGANISLNSTLDGAHTLTMKGGTGGTVSFGALGATTALTSVTASGATVTQNSTIKTTGAISLTGTIAVNIGGNATTAGGIIAVTGPAILTANTIFDSTNGGSVLTGANISLSSTLNGADTFSATSGTSGTINIAGQIGNTTPLTSLTFSGASITQGSTAKTTGAIHYTGVNSIGGNITTSGGAVTLTGASTLAGNSTVDTTNGGNVTGANITFTSSIDGAHALILNGGTTPTMAFGTVGGTTPLTSLTATGSIVSQNSSVTTTGAINYTSNSLLNINGNLTTRGGAITLTGPVTLNTSIVADTTNAGATSAGANISFSNTINGTSALTLSAGTGGIVSFGGAIGAVNALTQLSFTNASAIQVANNITLSGANPITFISPVTLTGPCTINPNNANVSFDSTLDGAQTLTINGGTNTSTFTGAIGGITPLTSLSVTGVTITQSSSNTTTGQVSYTGSTAINVGGNITTNGGIISLNGPLTISNSPTLDATNSGTVPAGANISFSNTTNGATALTLLAGTGGNISFANAIGGTNPLTNLIFTSANQIQIGNNITVTGANPLTFPSPVRLTGASQISSNNANINFSNTIDGAQNLTLSGGAGSTTFSSAIGGTTPLTSLSATAGIITQNSTVKTTGALSYTGSTAINANGNITTSGGTIALAGPTTITSNPTFDGTNGGAVATGATISFGNTLNGATALTLNAGTSGNISFGGVVGGINALTNLIFTNANSIKIGNNITVTGANPLAFPTPVLLTGTSQLNSNNANITFSSTVNGAQALTLTGGAGTATFSGALGGSTPLTSLAASASVINQNSTVQTTGPISFTGSNAINTLGNIKTSGGAINLTGPVNISNNPTFDTTNAGGTSAGANISFSSTLNGANALTLQGGTGGNLSFTGAVGGTTPLTSLTFNSANNAAANNLTVGFLTQSSGNGTTTFNGAISTSNALGINLTGNAFTFNNTVTTTNGGSLQIANSGLLTMPVAATLTLSGPLMQTGAGTSKLGNSITSSDEVLFTGSVALINNTSIDTSAASHDIIFMNTIDNDTSGGPFNLTLAAGLSNITIQGNIGQNQPIGAFLINNAENITLAGVTGNSLTINSGAGTTTINGDQLIGSGGINITGNNFVENANVTTTNGGSLTLNNSGTTTGTGSNSVIVDGNYSLIGSGPVSIGGSVVCNGNVLITSAATLLGPATFDTTGGTGNTTFLNTIDGPFNLTLLSNGGTIQFGGNVGSGIPIGALTLTGPLNVITLGIQATSISQTSGTGTTTFNGPLVTSGAAGISIATNAVVRGTAITTANTGPLIITNSGTFTSTAAGAINVDGAFTQNGSGAVSFAGSITADNAAISFASPITLFGATTLNSGLGSGNINLSQTVQGAFDLSLNSGTGTITIGGNVGTAITPLTSFTIARANNVSTQAIFASTISQLIGTGTTTFNGALNTSAAGGISLLGTDFTFNNTITTTGSGPLAITNSGLVAFTSGATGSIAGALTQTGLGTTQFSSSLTVGGAVQFNGSCTVSGTGSLSTQAANQPITFFSTLDGPGNLTLSTGSNDISIQGNAGSTTPLGNFTISTVRNATTQAIAAASLTQSAGTGTTLIQGNLTTNGATGISLTGAAFTFLQNVTTTNNGPVSITNSGTWTASSGKVITSNGSFTQNGSGNVQLGSSITTTNASPANAGISFSGTSPITLTAASTIDSSIGGGDITFSTNNPMNGPQSLTLNAGTGNVTILADFGTVSRLGAFTITSCHNSTTQAVTADSYTILNGTGTNTLGAINTNTPTGIALTGNNFALNAGLTTTNGGSLTIANSGVVTRTGTSNLDGSFIQSGTGSISIGGTTNARTGISIASPATITDPTLTIFNTSSAGGNIAFGSTADGLTGSENVNFNAGTGDINFTDPVGATVPLGTLTIQNAQNVNSTAVSAGSISGPNITGTATFNGALTTSAAGGIALNGNTFTFDDAVATTGSGGLSIVNSGPLIISNGTLFNLDGSFSQTGTGAVSIGNSITTSGDDISFASALLLTAPVSFDTGTGTGNIILGSTVDGAQSLTLAADGGNVTVQGSAGLVTPLTALTVSSADDVLFNGNVSISGPFTITLAAGTTDFVGQLTAQSIDLSGAAINFDNGVTSTTGAINVASSGILTVASTSPITSATDFIKTGIGDLSLGSNITTAGTLSIPSAITLTNDATLDSGGGDITLSDTVQGVFDLTLTAGSGDISLAGNIGAPRIGNFIVTSANNIITQDITASSITQQSGAGTSTLSGNLDTNTLGGITLIGNNFISSGAINTTNGGLLTITNSGLVTGTGASVITLDGAFLQNGTGPVNTGGTITTNDADITHTTIVSVLLPTTFTSNGGNIIFLDRVEGPACLTLAAGSGAVELEGAVGDITPLGCLTASGNQISQVDAIIATGAVQLTAAAGINVGSNITTNGNDIILNGNVTVSSPLTTLSTSGGGGNISVSGTVNGDVGGRSLTIETGTGDITLSGTAGGSNSFSNLTLTGNNISWANLGTTVIGATGATSLTAAGDINFTGTSYNNGNQFYTAGSDFNFTAGALTTISSNALPINFITGTLQLGAGTDLTVNSNGGDITLPNLLGTNRNLTLDAGFGNINFTQIGASGQNLNVVDMTATMFFPTPVAGTNVFANTLNLNSPTALTISTDQTIGALTYNTPVIFAGNINYTCGTAGTIVFQRSVDAMNPGVDSLTFDFDPCTGSLIFNGSIGSVAPLAFLNINAATDITMSGTVNVGSLDVTNGTGTMTAASGLTTTASGGISIATPVINLAGTITTQNGGQVTLNNSGALTVAAGSGFNLAGEFQQLGAGPVAIGGSIITQDSTILFTGPILLNGTTSFDSNALTGADIIFNNTIGGAQNLTLDAGNSTIIFSDAVGTSVTPINRLQIANAGNVNAASSIFASSLSQLAGTGTTTFNGSLNTNGSNGISLVGNTFNINNAITTTGNGPVKITNGGLLTLANATYSIAGAFTQNGTGPINLAGTFTTGGAVSFAQPVTLSDTTSFVTSSNNQNIVFSGELTNDLLGPHSLSLTAGTGDITFADDVGTTPIGILTIASARNVTAAAISATSILQSGGTGTTIINGDLTTSGTSGINLTGTNFTINSTVATSNNGPFSITNSGPLALTLGNATAIDGSFTQSGGGAVSLSGGITTNQQNISFANAIALTGSTNLSTGSGTGNINLSSAVNGNQPFILTAGLGNIVFGANLGATTPLGPITVNSVHNVTYPAINAASLVQSSGAGTATISTALNTSGILGVSIASPIIIQNGTITTTNSGPVTFADTTSLTVAANTSSAGAYTESGGGVVNLGGSIATLNQPISFADPVALTSDVILNTGTVGNTISFISAITGAQALTLSAVTGSITLGGGAVGTLATPLTSVTITSANNVSTEDIFAGFITQNAGTGTTTFNGALTTNEASGISLTGSGFTFNDAITTSTSGPLNIANTGLATFASSNPSSIAGALTQSGTGSTLLSSSITAGGAMQFNGLFSVSGSGSLSAQAVNQPITFFSAINGPGDLTLASGTADILLQGSAGSTTPLGNVTITSANNITTQSLTAASFTQVVGTGTTLINGDLTTNGAGGINLTGAAFTFLQNITTNGNGPISIDNSGTLTTTFEKTISSNGSFTQNGSGSILLGSQIETTNLTAANANINFIGSSPITLIAPAFIDSSTGGGTITFGVSCTVDGNQSLTLTAGTGDVNVLGSFGAVTRLGAFTIPTCNNSTVQDATANSYALLDGAGTNNLLGNLNTDTPAGITLIGNNFFVDEATTNTTNGGSVIITNSGLVTGAGTAWVANVDGSFIVNGTGIAFMGGTINARGGISFSPPIIIADPTLTTLNSSAGSGGITFLNLVSGFTGTENALLTAGPGPITFAQPLGLATSFGPIPVTPLGTLAASGSTISINDVGTAGTPGVNGTLALTASDTINFTGTNYNGSTQNYAATMHFEMDSGSLTTFNSNDNPLTFTGADIDLSSGTDLTILTGGTDLTLGSIHAQTDDLRNVILNAGSGAIQIGNLGTSGGGEFASATFTASDLTVNSLIANTIDLNYTGTLNTNGTIATSDTALSFPGPVVLQNTGLFSTVGATGADITFSDTVDSITDNGFGLTLNAGTGDISFAASIGATHPLLNLIINGAHDVTLASTASMNVGSLSQTSGTGTTTFNGLLSVPTAVGISLTGNNFAFNNTVQTLNGGPLIISNTGTLSFDGTGNISGAFTQNGTGPVALDGSITASQPILFTGPVTLSGNSLLDTSAASQNITFLNSINGAGNLTFAAGGGNLSLQGNAGTISRLGAITINSAHNITAQAITAQSVNLISATGTTTLNGAMNTNGAAGVHLVGNNFTFTSPLLVAGGGFVVLTNSGLVAENSGSSRTIDGSYTQNGTGPVNFAGSLTTLNGPISFASALTLLGPSSFNSSANNQDITFLSTVDGPSSLTVNAGTGDILIDGNIGMVTPLSSMTISAAHDVTVQTVFTGSLIQSAGTGTTTLNGNVSTAGVAGINLTGTNFIREANLTTTGTGPIIINNSGSFTSTAAGTISADGDFNQSGSGSVLISGTVNADNEEISFASPITLAGDTSLNAGVNGGAITFNNTIDGTTDGMENLTLQSGDDDTLFQNSIGGTTRLGAITVQSARNVTSSIGLSAAAFLQLAGTGTTSLDGTTDINTISGIQIATNSIDLTDPVTTSANGPIILTNSGTLTASGSIQASGAFTQNGTGSSNLNSADITSGGSISFNGAVTATGSSSLTTASQPITLASTLNGPGGLTFDAGTADITLTGAAGTTTRLGTLTFASAHDIATNSITAGSITQSAGSGVTTINGNINTNLAAGINLTGAGFSINGNVNTSAGGPLLIDHSAPSSFIFGNTTLVSGSFAESGSGTISLAGNLNTNNADITFNNPITLTNTSALNSGNGSGDILIQSTIDGAANLTLSSGTGNTTLMNIIGGGTALTSLVINSANNVTTQGINAGSLSQNNGSGLTSFNGPLITSTVNGIQLTGNQFTFNGAVTTQNQGVVQITNSGLLTILSGSPFNLSGAFSQLTTSNVSLADNITTDGQSVLFTGPVDLGHAVTIDVGNSVGNITFLKTVSGLQDLNLMAGLGTISFAQNVGAIGALSVNTAQTFTSQSITAASIDIASISTQATINGNLNTSGAPGISLDGAAFTLNGNIATTNGGPFTVNNSGLLTLASNFTFTIDGPVLQSGTGSVQGGGTLTTNNQTIQFQSSFRLTGNLLINSGSTGDDITLAEMNGPFNLSIEAGVGNVTCTQVIGATPLNDFSVLSANDINLNGVGATSTGVTGTMTLQAAHDINLNNIVYMANAQSYSAGNAINLLAGVPMNFTSFGSMTFANGAITLSNGNDFNVTTNNGDFSYFSILGNTFENININTGSGTASLNTIANPGTINELTVNAGKITFAGPIDPVDTTFISLTDIANAGAPVAITTQNTPLFNALHGDVGTMTNPISVNSSDQIVAGSTHLANFIGSSIDNSVQALASNPPCLIIFNNVTILNDCTPIPPIPPVPPVPPAPIINKDKLPFNDPGFNSSFFNLASDYYFFPDFFDECYFYKIIPMYWRNEECMDSA